MKNKLLVSLIIFFVVLLSIVFASSYAKVISKQEELEIKEQLLEQELSNNTIIKEETNNIYQNMDRGIGNCYNNCEYNENCPIYNQDSNYCIYHNNHHQIYGCRKDCYRQMYNK